MPLGTILSEQYFSSGLRYLIQWSSKMLDPVVGLYLPHKCKGYKEDLSYTIGMLFE